MKENILCEIVESLASNLSTAQLIDYLVWCARQVQHLIKDKRSIEILNIAESYVKGEASIEAIKIAADIACEIYLNSEDAEEYDENGEYHTDVTNKEAAFVLKVVVHDVFNLESYTSSAQNIMHAVFLVLDSSYLALNSAQKTWQMLAVNYDKNMINKLFKISIEKEVIK